MYIRDEQSEFSSYEVSDEVLSYHHNSNGRPYNNNNANYAGSNGNGPPPGRTGRKGRANAGFEPTSPALERSTMGPMDHEKYEVLVLEPHSLGIFPSSGQTMEMASFEYCGPNRERLFVEPIVQVSKL